MHAFLRASLSNHIASLLLFFTAQGVIRDQVSKQETLISSLSGEECQSHSKEEQVGKGCCYSYLGNMVGYTPPEISVYTILPLFLAAGLYALHIKWFLHSLPFPWVPPIRRSEGEGTVSLGYLLTKIYPCEVVLSSYTQDPKQVKNNNSNYNYNNPCLDTLSFMSLASASQKKGLLSSQRE